MHTNTTHPPTDTPHPMSPVHPSFSLVRHFREELSPPTEEALERQVTSFLTPEVTYIGIHLLRPTRGSGGSTALSCIWINVCAETGTPFLCTSRNMLFPILPDGMLGNGEVVR